MPTRTEKVRLVLDDQFSGKAARAAASTEALKREIDGLERSAVRASGPTSRLGDDVDTGSQAFRRGSADIDRYSGRLKVLTQVGLGLGPSLTPLVVSLVPAVTGLATGLAGAAGAAAAAGLAFAGVGDALDALNDFQLEPSAENLAKLNQAMDELGPAGANFVRYLDSISGELETLQQIAGNNMFPGMTAGLQSLLGLMPRVRDLVGDLAARMGHLSADAGEALAGEEWEAFFSFLKTDAAPIFEDFARAAGNVTLGLGNMMVAFAPLSRDFASGLLDASRAFAAWSADSSNFEEFIDYVRQVGPQAIEFFSALGDAAIALGKAVAPWGSMVLPAMTALLNVFTAIAGSPIGPALTTAALGMLAFNKAAAASSLIMGRVTPAVGSARQSFGQMRADLATVATTWATAGAATERESKKMAAASGRLKTSMAGIGKGAAVVGAVGLAASGAAEGFGLQNTAMLGLTGTVAGPWGAAIGAAIGLLLDFKAAQSQSAAEAKDFAATLDTQTGSITESSKAFVTSKLSADQINKMRDLGLNIGEVSEALAGGTKTWDKYYDSLSDTQKAMLRTRESFFDFSPIINDLDGIAAASDDGKTAFEAQGDAVDGYAASAQAAVGALNELTAAQQAATQAALAGIDAGTAYGAALAKANAQADEGTKGLSKYTEAGRANRTALSQLIASYNNQDAATKNSVKGYNRLRRELAEIGREMGLSGEQIASWQARIEKPAALRVQTEEAQAAIRGAKVAFESLPGEVMSHIMTSGVPRTTAQIDALVAKYKLTEEQRTALITLKDAASAGIGNIIGLIHNVKGKTVKVGVDTAGAVSNVRAVQAVINSLQGKTVTVTTLQKTVYGSGKMAAIAQGRATGGPIYGPGTGTSDDIPIWASNGEFMIRAAAVDKYGVDFFERLNAMKYANGGPIHPRGAARFASGGQVRGTAVNRDGGTKSALKSLEKQGKRLERSMNRAERTVDKAKRRLDYWNDKRNQLKSDVKGSLKKDWFNSDASVWSATAAGGTAAFAQQQWTQQIKDSKALAGNIANLRKNGAGDAFIAEILRSEDPLAAARMFNKQSVGGLRQSQKLFLEATRRTQGAANSTTSIFADEQRAATRQLRAANKRLHGIEKAINKNHKQAESTRKKTSASKSVSKGKRSQTRSKKG